MAIDAQLSRAFGRLTQAQHDLDEATLGIFSAFESQHVSVAQALVQWIGDRRKAARWMTFQRHVFQGKSGFELVIEGDVDTLWEHICAIDLPKHDTYSAY